MKLFALAAVLLLGAAPLHAQPAKTCARRPAIDTTRVVQDSGSAVYRGVERGMAEEVRAAARAAGVDRAEGLLVLHADSLNQTRIVPAEINFPVDVLRQIEPRLQALIAKLPEAPACPLLVRIDPAVQRPGRRERKPEILNQRELSRYLATWVLGDRRPAPSRLVLAGVVTRSGRGIAPEVVQSSGDPELDAFVLELFRMFKFRPASVDGSPVDAWMIIPVATQVRW
jgi:hypothetical protein